MTKLRIRVKCYKKRSCTAHKLLYIMKSCVHIQLIYLKGVCQYFQRRNFISCVFSYALRVQIQLDNFLHFQSLDSILLRTIEYTSNSALRLQAISQNCDNTPQFLNFAMLRHSRAVFLLARMRTKKNKNKL